VQVELAPDVAIGTAGASQSFDILGQDAQVFAGFDHELHPDPNEIADRLDLLIVLDRAALDRDHAFVKRRHNVSFYANGLTPKAI
jgi:hypothetical protein